jgi:hypothetical protein
MTKINMHCKNCNFHIKLKRDYGLNDLCHDCTNLVWNNPKKYGYLMGL